MGLGRLDQRHSVRREARCHLRAASKFAARPSGELPDGSVVDGQVLVAVESGWILDAVGPVRALIDGQAGPLTKAVRARAHGVGR
jgi:hypothetical protein